MSEPKMSSLVARGAVGGLLMGLANLVPGISGGTMLLAAGVYQRFIDAIAEVSTFRFRAPSILLLAVIGGTALLAILLLAGAVGSLVADHRWAMYSLFVGLTLGGVPLVWRMARPIGAGFFGGAVAGLAVMALMAFTTAKGAGADSALLLAVAGMAAASAMILPGVSGAYLFLVLGQYERILAALDTLKNGAIRDALPVVIPVAIGALIGVVAVSNLVRWTLRHHKQATLGVLMGLLCGSVLGIYPFSADAVSALRVAMALGLAAAGFVITRLIDRIAC